MAIIKLDSAVRAYRVGHPCLRALALSTDPATDKIAIVGIPLAIGKIEVKETMGYVSADGKICINSFYAKIQFGQFRELRKVKAPSPSRPVGVGDRGKLIVRESIQIKCNPITEFRKAIGKIEGTASIARIQSSARKSIRCIRQAEPEFIRGEGYRRAGKYSGAGKAEFKILGWT